MKIFYTREEEDDSEIFSTPTTLKTNFRSKIGPWLVLMIFGLAMLIPSNMQAQHPFGFMDGNALNDNNKLDWEDIWNAQVAGDFSTLPAGSITTGIVYDAMSPDVIFTGGGTKDFLPINGATASQSWQHKTAAGSSSNKTNILHAGAILIDGIIYFSGNRLSAEGSTNIGFWLFQDEVRPIGGGRFSGEHTDGDILVVAEIVNGGSAGQIAAYKWDEENGTLTSSSKTMSSLEANASILDAIVNPVSIQSPWPKVEGGVDIFNMPAITFFEGFINIKQLIENGELDLGANCFSTFIIETRASFSLSSILEDFVGGNFDVEPRVTLDGLIACEDDFEGTTLAPVVSGGLGTLDYQWYFNGDPIAEEDGGKGETLTVTESGTYSVIVTGDGIGGTANACASEEVSAEVIIYPTVSAGTGENARYCEDDEALDSVDLFALLTDEDEGGVWTDEADAEVDSPIDLSSYEPGEYIFKYKVTPEEDSECLPDDESVTITIDASVTAGSGENARYCEDDTALASVDLLALLTGEDPDGVWTNAENVGVQSPIDLSTFAPGAYTFKYTVTPATGSVCPGDDESVTITIDATVSAGTGQNDSYCIDDPALSSVDLLALLSGEDAGGVWTNAANVEVQSPIDLSTFAAGTYTYKYTVTPSAAGSLCPTDDESVTISIDEALTAGTGENDRYCEDDTDLASVDLFALLTGEDSGGVWTNAANVEVQSPIDLSTFAPASYTFKYTITPETSSQCEPDDESVTITIDASVTAGTGENDRYCEDDTALASVDLFALLTGEDPDGVWTNASNGTVTSPINLSSFAAGAYTFKYTVTPATGSECPADDESVTITINPLPTVTLAPVSTLCTTDDPIQLVGSPTGGEYSGTGVSSDGLFNPGVANLGDNTIRYTYTDTNGCTNYAEIVINVETCVTGEGCTLGYWKTHTDRWCEKTYTITSEDRDGNPIIKDVTISPCTLYGDVFVDAPSTGKLDIAGLTLFEALSLVGNSSGENLARQSVAALLNTCSSEVGYAYSSVDALIEDVNQAWSSNPKTQNSFAIELDVLNNADCPLSGTNATLAPDCDSTLKVAEANALDSETSVVVNSFSVSPVPFRESLSVRYDFDYVSDVTIQMFDLQGRLLLTQKEANASQGKVTDLSINFRILPSQVYVIKVTTDRDVFIKKIISDN